MSATPEAKVKDAVKKQLAPYVDAGAMWVNWPVPYGYGAPMLDCIGVVAGKAFSIETKAPGETLTPRQQFTKSQMELAGMKVFVIGEGSLMREELYPYTGMFEMHQWIQDCLHINV